MSKMTDEERSVLNVLSRHRHEPLSGSKIRNFVEAEEGLVLTWQEVDEIRYKLRHEPRQVEEGRHER